MKKTNKIDYSEGRLMRIAIEKLENNDSIGALKMLRMCEYMNGGGRILYSLFADAFGRLDLPDKAIFYWFKCIDTVPTAYDLIFDDYKQFIAYKGLSDNYEKLDNDIISGYYAQLFDGDEQALTVEKCELLQKELDVIESMGPKIAYPPKDVDYSKTLVKALDLIRDYKMEEGMKLLDKIEEGNPLYLRARNCIVMCHMSSGNVKLAEEEYERMAKKYPDDYMTWLTAADIKVRQSEHKEEGKEIVKKLAEMKIDDVDDIFKVANLCAVCSMTEEAYQNYRKLEDRLGYTKNYLYLKAASAFNSKRIEEAFKLADIFEILYPEGIIGRVNFAEAKQSLENKDQVAAMPYVYSYGKENEDTNNRLLNWYVYDTRPNFDVKVIKPEVEACIQWCLDAIFVDNPNHLKKIALATAIKIGSMNFVIDALLNHTYAEEIKRFVVGVLANRKLYGDYGVVLNDIYRKIIIRPIYVGRKKAKDFQEAYARLMEEFGISSERNSLKIADTCEKVYRILKDIDELELLENSNLIAAAVYSKSNIKVNGLTKSKVAEHFGVDKAKLELILGVL